MPVTINDFTYTNGNSGRTRVNAQGLIVGVDFSTTSNTIATGSKTFTLAATANVNRDWPVGSSLVAVAQAGATGSMIGTVTSYDPATQVLVMNVTSITGSGTSTDWRIGSTMVRELNGVYDFRTYNPLTFEAGGLFEGGATNVVLRSEDATNAYWTKFNVVASLSTGMNYGKASLITDSTDASATLHQVLRETVNTAADNRWGVVFKKTNHRYVYIAAKNAASANPTNRAAIFDLDTGTIASNTGNAAYFITDVGNGEYLCEMTTGNAAGESQTFAFGIADTATNYIYQGSGARSVLATGFMSEPLPARSSRSSYIPTTTVAVSRAGDQLSVGGTNFNQFYNATQGTLVMELTPIAQAVGAVAGSLNDGTLNNAIRIQQKQSGTLSSIRKMATDGVTDVIAVDASVNTLRANGVDYTAIATGVLTNARGAASSALNNFLIAGNTGRYSQTTNGGLTYTNFQMIAGDQAQLRGAAFGGGTYVVVGDAIGGSGLIATIDPSTFAYTRRSPGFGANNIFDVIRSGTRFIIAAATNRMGYSDDNGVTWVSVEPVVFAATDFFSLASNGTTAVAVGQGGRLTVSANNGTTWSEYNNAFTVGTNQQQNGVSWANGIFVSVGNGGTISTSPTGAIGSWTLRTSGVTSNLFSVMYSTRDSMWYAAGDNGVILRAADPTGTWTSISNDATVGIFTAGALQANPLAGKFIPNVKNRVAITWTAGSGVKISINGATPVADPSVIMPVLTQYSVGMNGVSGQHWNSTIKLQRAYRVAVPDAELQALARI